jgi:hypothetical protein
MTGNPRIRQLRARELQLLQERTKLQRRVEESLSGAGWAPEMDHQLEAQKGELEGELATLRAEMRRLEREEPLPGG